MSEQENMPEVNLGTLRQALDNGRWLLSTEPDVAEAQARAILKLVPNQPQALLLLGTALQKQHHYIEALDVLEPLAEAQPSDGPIQVQLAWTLRAAGRHKEAIKAFRRIVSVAPQLGDIWQSLGDLLERTGDHDGAEQAYACRASLGAPAMQQAISVLRDGRPADAEGLVRGILKDRPEDPVALWCLAEAVGLQGLPQEAARHLATCLEFAPDFDAARYNYATVLFFQAELSKALEQVERLLARDPDNIAYRLLSATTLTQIGEYDQAQVRFADVLQQYPNQPAEWMSYGHVLKTLGHKDKAIAAFHRARELVPGLGQAWWSLANLKTYRFGEGEIQSMEAQLARPNLADEDRIQIHFALGKAFEDACRYEPSFTHYLEGATLRRQGKAYDPDATTAHVERSKAVFTSAFFAGRKGAGCPVFDPIFVVGLPRAGSTLVEQILSSHSAVEGTMELPNIPALVRRLAERKLDYGSPVYPKLLTEMEDGELTALGEEYLEGTRIQRKRRQPFFIDKMPNNFAHVGLIHLILPNARIIDVRRDPMANCFSAFKQHFARGQHFSYDLIDLGRYYVDYVRLMDHVDQVLPGRVHRIYYERLVADPEREVRALLTYCGLPFEPSCLRFHENTRPVRTPSAEQVRQPIFTDAVEHWRHYEPWLDPLKSALEPVLKAGTVKLATVPLLLRVDAS